MKSNKEYRCQNCHSLQFKYRIERDEIIVETKCYSCNAFNYFTINLEYLTDAVNLLKKAERETT